MKKIFVLSFLVLVSFTLTACTILPKKAEQKLQDTQNKLSTNVKNKIEDIFANPGSKECTYSVAEGGTGTTGVIYIDGKRMAHYMKLQGDKPLEINYIMKEDWLYSWGNQGMPAMKMQIGELSKLGDQTKDSSTTQGNIDYKKLGFKSGLDLACKEWKVDESKFTVPTTLQFTDVTATMKDFGEKLNQTNEKIKDMSNAKCSACNMAPDENTKKECLASLGCN